MTTEEEQLEAAIAALEAQRAVLGDAVVASALGPLRARLAALRAADAAPTAGADAQAGQHPVPGRRRLDALSQRLDPEDTSAVMDGTLARAAAIVGAHHGKVLQYAGDSLLAAFGADEPREDDAERAVRCGLALCRLGRTVGAEVQRARTATTRLRRPRRRAHRRRAARRRRRGRGTIRGITVNIAARLEQTAPPGAVRISHDTYALVRGVFEVEAQPPLQVKGVDAPMRSYLVRAREAALRRAADARHRRRGDADGRPRRRARARCSDAFAR